MKKLILILLLSISLCILSSCSIESDNSKSYSRDSINNFILSGYGANSQEIIACKYIYSNDEFSKLYGENFEIKDALCTSEMENSLGIIKGNGECLVYINNDIWCVTLEKNYFEKWNVKEYFKCAVDPDDGNIIVKNGEIVKTE
jgi:hypothetical protein